MYVLSPPFRKICNFKLKPSSMSLRTRCGQTQVQRPSQHLQRLREPLPLAPSWGEAPMLQITPAVFTPCTLSNLSNILVLLSSLLRVTAASSFSSFTTISLRQRTVEQT